jgi:hypothetical protein
VDYPDVIDLRRQLFPERSAYFFSSQALLNRSTCLITKPSVSSARRASCFWIIMQSGKKEAFS